MITYITELAIIHLLLSLGYWIFLRKESQYDRMRVYLLAITVISIIVPLLRLPSFQSLFISEDQTEAFAINFNPANALVLQPESTSQMDFRFLYWIYGIIVAYFIFKILRGLVFLLKLEARSEYHRINDFIIRKVADLQGTFSFFKWIFVSKEVEEKEEEYTPIIYHEYAHTRLGHSYDLLFLQLFQATFWWLPTAWYIQKEIKKIHEYQADAYALKTYSVDQYSSILISSTLKSNGLSLASSFHDGLILKRLKAMKQNVKQIKPWKLRLLGTCCILIVIAFSCNDELDKEIKKMGEASNAITFDQLPSDMQTDLNKLQDKLSFIKIDVDKVEIDENGKPKYGSSEELKSLDPELIYSINVIREENAMYVALKKEGENFDYVANTSKSDDEVFTIVEKQPEYPGGMNEFYKFVADNMRYPAEARQKGIQGGVYVQFVINEDGSTSDIKAIKGIGASCDQEAVRVISESGNWIPGSQRGENVKVRMVLPIIFKLDGQPSNTSPGFLKKEGVELDENGIAVKRSEPLEEIVIIGYGSSDNDKFFVEAKFENGTILGKVTMQNGKPLSDVSIIEAGTSSGTVTDAKGNFKIELNNPDNEIVLSHVGYKTVRVSTKK